MDQFPTEAFARGYQQAVADVKKPWWVTWFRARELADDALYAPGGLTEEQRGYVAGLAAQRPMQGAELPGAIAEPMRLRDQLQLGPRPTAPLASGGKVPPENRSEGAAGDGC